MTSVVASARRVVVKVGSSLVTNDGRASTSRRSRAGRPGGRLRELGKQVLLVSSGAIAEGMQRLGGPSVRSRSMNFSGRAVGQMGSRARTRRTSDGTESRRRRSFSLMRTSPTGRATSTLVPRCSPCWRSAWSGHQRERTVVTDEIKFGDNDTLGASSPTWSRRTCS